MIGFYPLIHDEIEDVVSLMEKNYAFEGTPFVAEDTAKLFNRFIENDRLGKAWGIYNNDQLIGYMIISFFFSFEQGGICAFINELFLLEEHRGKGISKKAVEFILKEADKLRLKTIFVEKGLRSVQKNELFEEFGFREHSKPFLFYNTGSESI